MQNDSREMMGLGWTFSHSFDCYCLKTVQLSWMLLMLFSVQTEDCSPAFSDKLLMLLAIENTDVIVMGDE